MKLRDLRTHSVHNQVPEMGDADWFGWDRPLMEHCTRFGAGHHVARLQHFGTAVASVSAREHGELANRYHPELRRFDRFGHRIDVVDFHPSYHHLMDVVKNQGMHSIAWTAETGGHVAHTAMLYMLTQTEAGMCCPLTMTYAGVPTLKHHTGLVDSWLPKVLASNYDGNHQPVSMKTSAMLGMAMTEKQGGSDVRANQTRAVHQSEDVYRLTGHKWFCSAPMSDGFFTLAHTDKGLTCFLVPRFLPDGQKNNLIVQRLKDKLGNRSNASSEIEYDNTWAIRVGDEGRGVPTIIEMVHHTRLDCATAAVGLMRQSLVQAVHHARHRKAFGQFLIDQPLMRHVLTDLSVEWEASLAMIFRIAQSYDQSQDDEQAAFSRLAVAVGKYWTNKRCVPFVGEAMECLGGAGYVEESILPRLYREAPLNGIWEGSGNVICLDVLRTMAKEPNSVELFMMEVAQSQGADTRFDRLLLEVQTQLQNLSDPATAAWQARWITEGLGLLLQGHLLLSQGDATVAEGFLATRLQSTMGESAFGATRGLQAHQVQTVLDRALSV